MEREEKNMEVIYKFYLPDNSEDLRIFSLSREYHLALIRVFTECRKVWKYEENPSEDKVKFAKMIGEIVEDCL